MWLWDTWAEPNLMSFEVVDDGKAFKTYRMVVKKGTSMIAAVGNITWHNAVTGYRFSLGTEEMLEREKEAELVRRKARGE